MASQAPLSPSVQRAANRRTFLAQLLKAGGLTAAAPMFAGERSLRAQDENKLPLAIEGYFDRMSCLPGEVAGLHVSTSADTYSVQVIRVGAQPKTYWQAKGLTADLYPVPADVAMAGCGWPAAVQLPVGKDWPSGLYVARLQGQRGQEKSETRDALLIVRSLHPGKQHQILYQIATNTYQAYNEWGGTNLLLRPQVSPRLL